MSQDVRSYIAEFPGVFTLVFIGSAVATLQGTLLGYDATGWLGISFASGFTFMVLVWVISPIIQMSYQPGCYNSYGIVRSPRLVSAQLGGFLPSILHKASAQHSYRWVLL